MIKTSTTITYKNKIFELGSRDASRLALFLECSPPLQHVIDFVATNYGPSCGFFFNILKFKKKLKMQIKMHS
jgi:hypothetical protein